MYIVSDGEYYIISYFLLCFLYGIEEVELIFFSLHTCFLSFLVWYLIYELPIFILGSFQWFWSCIFFPCDLRIIIFESLIGTHFVKLKIPHLVEKYWMWFIYFQVKEIISIIISCFARCGPWFIYTIGMFVYRIFTSPYHLERIYIY